MSTPMISPMRSSMRLSMINPDGGGLISRYFTDSNGANTYYQFTPIVFTGDFRVRILFNSKITSGLSMMLGQSASTLNFSYLDGATGAVISRLNNINKTTTKKNLNDGAWHELGIERDGTLVSYSIDGVFDSNSTVSGDVEFNVLARNQFGNYFDGLLADPYFNDESGAENVITSFTIGNSISDGDTEESAQGNNTLTYVLATDRELFTKDSVNDWVGTELSKDADMKNSLAWINNITFPYESFSHSGTGISADSTTGATKVYTSQAGFEFPMIQDRLYRLASKLLKSTGDGDVTVKVATAPLGTNILAVISNPLDGTIYSEDIVSPTTDSASIIQLQTATVIDYDTRLVSVKRVLPTAKKKVHVIGDSFATSMFRQSLQDMLGSAFSVTIDGVPGSTLAEQKIRFDSTPEFYDDILVIMDGGLTDTSGAATTAINGMTSSLTTSKWVWVQPTPREMKEGQIDRDLWNADTATIEAFVGVGHYSECLTALKAGNNGSANDLQDVADNIVPRSLRIDDTHENLKGTKIRTGQISIFIKTQGW